MKSEIFVTVVIFFACIALALAYTADPYDNIQSILNNSYTADSYDNIILILEELMPEITASATSPDIVYINTDFKFNMTATDPDNATFTGYVQFYVNGTASGSMQNTSISNNTNTLIGTLSNSSFGKGAKLIAEFWAGDGIENTTKGNTTEETAYDREEIDCSNMDDYVPIVINGSNGFTIDGEKQIVWTYCSGASNYLYYNNYSDYIVANSTTQLPMEVEFGNGTSYNPTSVWDSNYKMVQHLQEDPSGSAPQIIDSTTNLNNGTSYGTMTSSDQITGKIDGSLDFDGSDDYVNCTNDSSLDITDEITIEAWFNATQLGASQQNTISDTFTNENNIAIKTNLSVNTTAGQVKLDLKDDWLSGWDNRIKFTINNTKIDSALTWFPVTVFLNGSQAEEIFTEFDSDSDYLKVAFTKSDGTTELYAEKELFQVLSQYPPAQNSTYVKATTEFDWEGTIYAHAYDATDPQKSLTGTYADNTWLSNGELTQRFHIDLGSAKVIKRIYYENYHHAGGQITRGVQNFTFWGSNTAGSFADLNYTNNTGWTQLTTNQSTFDNHTASDVADPKYIIVTNSIAYRHYAFKFADNHNGDNYVGVRRIELQTEQTAIYHVSRDGWAISNTSDTDFYMYYDNDHADNTNYIGAIDTTAGENVWDSNFKAVYHMQDGANTSHTYDSTSNNNDGTKLATNEPIEATGKVGQAQDFDGDNDYINCGALANLKITGNLTIEAIANIDTFPAGGSPDYGVSRLVDMESVSDGYSFYIHAPGLALQGFGQVDDTASKTATINTSTDYYVAASDNAGTVSFYQNGTALGTDTKTSGYIASSNDLNLGRFRRDDKQYIDGRIDEVRISDTNRSATWLKATYNTLWDSLLTYGGEETDKYKLSGELWSTNLLSGQNVSLIDSFGYNVSSIPTGTNLTVQFSQDNSTWKNSTGTIDGWDNLSSGAISISLSSLSWSGANFYYKMQFISNEIDTPILDDINVTFTPHAGILAKENSYELKTSSTSLIGVINNGTSQEVSYSVSAGQWYNSVLTYNGSIMKLYLNGTEVANKSVTGSINTNSNDLFIGSLNGSSNYFNGTIDSVRISNTSRSASYINQTYQNTLRTDGYGEINTAPAQPGLTYPANDSYITSITMNWSASSDAEGDIVYYYVLVNGTQACYTADLNCSYSPNDGYYQWNVTPYDGTVNGTTSSSRYYTYDTTNPSVSITYPAADQHIKGTTLWVNGTATETNEDTITINDTNWGTNNGTYSSWAFKNTSTIADGAYSIKITANDSLGHINNTETVSFTVDNTNPSLTITTSNNTYHNPPTIEGTASDTNADTIYANNTAWTWNNTYTNWKLTNNTNIPDGNYHILITANDSAGNTNSSLFVFTYDATLPILNFTLPTEANQTTVTRNWTQANMTIDEEKLDTLRFSWNNTNYTFYDDLLVLALNFNNNSEIGENSTYAVDISGYGNNGTAENGAHPITSGKFSGAYEFDGINDYVNVSDSASLSLTVLSIGFWFKPEEEYNSTTDYISFVYHDDYEVFIDNGSMVFNYQNNNISSSTTSWSKDQWYHVSATYDGSTQALYVNGLSETSASVSSPFTIKNSDGENTASFFSSGDIILKGSCSAGSCSYPGNDAFIIQNSSGDTVAYINSTGDLCIEDSNCNDNDANCNNPGDGSFIVKDSNDIMVSYINATGHLCLTGDLTKNGSP